MWTWGEGVQKSKNTVDVLNGGPLSSAAAEAKSEKSAAAFVAFAAVVIPYNPNGPSGVRRAGDRQPVSLFLVGASAGKINETRFAHSVRTWGQLSLSLACPTLSPILAEWAVAGKTVTCFRRAGGKDSYMRLQNYLLSCCCPRSSVCRQ